MNLNDRSAIVYKHYVLDLGYLIREMAVESKRATTEENSGFSMGYMAAFHRVVSLMQQQADAFGISLADIALDGIDPDIEFV